MNHVLGITLLISLMVRTGLETDARALVASLRRYGYVGAALLTNIALVPLYGVGLCRLFNVATEPAIGVILMTLAPGAPFIVATAGSKKGGSNASAVQVMVVLAAVSAITAPLLLNWATPHGTHTSIHPLAIVAKLIVLQLVPLAVGIGIATLAPKTTATLKIVFTIAFIASLLAILVTAGPRLYHALLQVSGTKAMVVAFLTTVLGMVTGFILGGRDLAARRTLSLATALRNPGLASTLAASYFPHSKLAVLSALAYFFVQIVTANVAAAVVRRFSIRDARAGAPGPS
jgi:bile acid:Na+ symporter, BASS family